MLKFICYPKCTTCQRAKKWLDDNRIEYELRDIKLENPTLEELTEWYEKSALPLKRFFNTSGLLYKSLDLKNRLPEMSEVEMLELLATDGECGAIFVDYLSDFGSGERKHKSHCPSRRSVSGQMLPQQSVRIR